MTEPIIWDDLGETWRALDTGADTAASLRRAIDRGTARLRWVRRAEATVTVLVLAVFGFRITALPVPSRWWWIGLATAHVAIVYAFTVVNRRGVWAPLGESTRDYLRLARLRLVRARRAAGFAGLMIGIEAALLLGMLAVTGRARTGLALAVALAPCVVGVWAVAYRRWKSLELARLERAWHGLDPMDDDIRTDTGPFEAQPPASP